MIKYLKKLRSYYNTTFKDYETYQKSNKKIHLIWDIFAAHRDQKVRE
jgi:hypothetical protein